MRSYAFPTQVCKSLLFQFFVFKISKIQIVLNSLLFFLPITAYLFLKASVYFSKVFPVLKQKTKTEIN